jgi:hypothetical protein
VPVGDVAFCACDVELVTGPERRFGRWWSVFVVRSRRDRCETRGLLTKRERETTVGTKGLELLERDAQEQLLEE